RGERSLRHHPRGVRPEAVQRRDRGRRHPPAEQRQVAGPRPGRDDFRRTGEADPRGRDRRGHRQARGGGESDPGAKHDAPPNAVAKKLVESGPGHPNGVGFTAIGEDGTYRLVTVPGLILLQAGVDANVTAEGVRTEHKFRPPVPDPKYPDYFVKRDPYWHYYM